MMIVLVDAVAGQSLSRRGDIAIASVVLFFAAVVSLWSRSFGLVRWLLCKVLVSVEQT